MAYISSEEVKQIRDALKQRQELKGFKLSVTRKHHSTVLITFVEGQWDLGETYRQLNVYYPEKIENSTLRIATEIVLLTVKSIRAQEFRETGDYGQQPDFYISVHVGKYDRPYSIKPQGGK